MAKYKITYACGCTKIVQLYGPESIRRVVAERLRSQQCPECKGESAAEEAQTAGLVSLKGSPKQIAWAESIRMNAFNHHRILSREASGYGDFFRDTVRLLLNEPSAHWWISNRAHFTSLNSFVLFVNSLMIAC